MMVCVDGDALSVMVIAAVKDPAMAGLNLAVIVQLLPVARVVEQSLDSLKLVISLPERTIFEMTNALLPVLRRVAVSGELDVVAATVPKAKAEVDVLADAYEVLAILIPLPQPTRTTGRIAAKQIYASRSSMWNVRI